jgi:hypothetical protein
MKNKLSPLPLTRAQSLVLQVVANRYYSDRDLEELRTILLDFNSRKTQEHLDEIVTARGYTQQDFENMLKGHNRISKK